MNVKLLYTNTTVKGHMEEKEKGKTANPVPPKVKSETLVITAGKCVCL
jgi:hypothetical protein